MESKLIKVKTDGDILRDAYVISGLEIDGSEYVVYYIDRDDGENDNIFASKLINNNDGTYSMLNIENANEKINVTNTVKELVMKAIEDSERDTLDSEIVNLRSKTVKLRSVVINKEQVIDIQKTYITTVKKSVTTVAKKYYDVSVNVAEQVVTAPVVEQPDAGIVSSVTAAPEVAAVPVQTVPASVEPVLPVLEPVQTVPVAAVPDATSVVQVAQPAVLPEIPVATTPVVNVQTSTPVLDIPAGIISEPVVQQAVTPAPVVEQAVVQPVQVASVVTPTVLEQPVVTPIVQVAQPVQAVTAPTVVQSAPVTAAPVVQVAQPTVLPEAPVVVPAQPVVEPIEPNKLVLDASKESNLNSALGEISKEAIAVADINAIKEFGEDDTPVVQATQPVASETPIVAENAPKVLTRKAGFANSKFFMFVAVGFFIASCIFMGYEAFNYYQIVK